MDKSPKFLLELFSNNLLADLYQRSIIRWEIYLIYSTTEILVLMRGRTKEMFNASKNSWLVSLKREKKSLKILKALTTWIRLLLIYSVCCFQMKFSIKTRILYSMNVWILLGPLLKRCLSWLSIAAIILQRTLRFIKNYLVKSNQSFCQRWIQELHWKIQKLGKSSLPEMEYLMILLS